MYGTFFVGIMGFIFMCVFVAWILMDYASAVICSLLVMVALVFILVARGTRGQPFGSTTTPTTTRRLARTSSEGTPLACQGLSRVGIRRCFKGVVSTFGLEACECRWRCGGGNTSRVSFGGNTRVSFVEDYRREGTAKWEGSRRARSQ